MGINVETKNYFTTCTTTLLLLLEEEEYTLNIRPDAKQNHLFQTTAAYTER